MGAYTRGATPRTNLLEVYMASDKTTEAAKRPYEAPTLERMPIGATANDHATNSDTAVFHANTAYPPS